MDVLTFEDEEHGVFIPIEYRQLMLNGHALAAVIADADGRDVSPSTPLTVKGAREHQLRYLRGLLGEPGEDSLREGRVAIGYCRDCLDSSCGQVVAASVDFGADVITWTAIGYEIEHVATLKPRFRGWLGNVGATVIEPDEWWTPNPLIGLAFAFDRAAYVAAVEAEIVVYLAKPLEDWEIASAKRA